MISTIIQLSPSNFIPIPHFIIHTHHSNPVIKPHPPARHLQSYPLTFNPTMTVPKHSTLHPSLPVSIVQKHHQSTGHLTHGKIATVLTRGDHPRGVKVRLIDGKVGRVQEIIQDVEPGSSVGGSQPSNSHPDLNTSRQASQRQQQHNNHSYYPKSPILLSHQQHPTTLGDYIIPPSSHHRSKTHKSASTTDNTQERFEKLYPNLDTALIAAILADHTDGDEAGRVLNALSTG